MRKKDYRYDKIRTYLKLNISIILLFAFTATLFNVGVAFIPTLQGYVINAFSEEKPFKYVLRLGLIYIAFLIFVQINRFLKRLLRRKFNNKMVLQMRGKAFSNLLLMDIDNFSSATYGDIMNRQLADIRDGSSAIETIVAEAFDSGVLLISYYVFMALIDLRLATICMSFALLAVLVSLIFGPFVRKFTREYKKVYSDTKKENIIVLQNEIYYRGFGINKNYYDKYESELNILEKKAVRNTIFRTSFEPLYLGLAALGYIFAFYYGGLKFVDGLWTLGTFTAFVASFTQARKKCGFVGRIINNIQNGLVAWTRCKGYMVSSVTSNDVEVSNNNGLYVSNMSFGYDDSFKLNNISFEAHNGEIIGICGRIRSGKTTLAGALSGVYEYDGNIILDGLELKDIRNDKIKNFIHYAPGRVEIFNDTIKYNITFGDEGSYEKAVDTACLRDDIDAFPNKDLEVLSHSLLNISGGQQRRLQIARCVFDSPRLVILDDPFNAIGVSMSIKIIENLKKNYPDTIFIIINNQSESLKLFDKIIYLENNHASFDSYDSLYATNKSFKALMGGEL